MTIEPVILALITVIGAATPLLFAALGETVVEKAGVLNLGVEGMMLVGAVAAFATAVGTESATLALLAAAFAGAAMALLFGFLTLSLLTSQVATGLALTIFGIGLSALIGAPYVGTPLKRLPRLDLPGLSDLPVVGPLLFSHDILVYAAIAMVPAIAWFLNKSRAGLILRAVGDSHDAAHAIGYNVIRIRYLAVLFGGMMAGLGGAYLSLAYTPMWIEQMTAGRGWIALALVVFAAWRPLRVLIGAYLFGGVTILQLHAQGGSMIDIPPQYLSMLPYIATIVVLTLMSSGATRKRLQAPACLGRPFHPTA
ncbi:MAG: ABC transporter permease [Pseudomonadota bacterium]